MTTLSTATSDTPAAEITGLATAQAYAAAMRQALTAAASTAEMFAARLDNHGVRGPAITALERARELTRQASDAWERAGSALDQQNAVRDAYLSTPGAGSKQFLTDGAAGSPAPDGSDTPAPAGSPASAGPEATGSRLPWTAAEEATLAAWSNLRAFDTSEEALRLRAAVDAIRRRHRPAPETNPYTGTIKLDELNLDPEKSLAEEAQSLRWTADMYDDNIRTGQGTQDADAALFWHAAADAVDAAAAAEPPASRAPWPGMDDESWQRWRHDEMILAQAQQLYGDEGTEQAAQLEREAAAIERRRKLAHRAAIKAGVTPCVASRSKHTPCVHPDGDHHEGLCFAADGESWPRHTSWWAPETWDNHPT